VFVAVVVVVVVVVVVHFVINSAWKFLGRPSYVHEYSHLEVRPSDLLSLCYVNVVS
jgi:hypothetical protein